MRAAKLLFSIFILAFLSSCFEPDEFPDTPRIEFESVKYIETSGIDSLILSFSFEDGDGNIGMNDNINDLLAPYHIFSFIVDSNGDVLTISRQPITTPLYELPVFVQLSETGETEFFIAGSRELFSDTDNRPPYNCESYEIFGSDTVYVLRNEFYHNFHIQFMKKSNGSYSEIDFAEIFQSDDCELGNFNGRIPLYDPQGREGVITYSMLSQLFRLSFLDDTIQLRFWIYDRSLNKSNIAESPDFILRDITRN